MAALMSGVMVPIQNTKRAFICALRSVPTLVMIPKVDGVFRVTFGFTKLKWFNALNMSKRTCMRRPSRIWKLRDRAKSMFQNPGPTIEFLPTFPGRIGRLLSELKGMSVSAAGFSHRYEPFEPVIRYRSDPLVSGRPPLCATVIASPVCDSNTPQYRQSRPGGH